MNTGTFRKAAKASAEYGNAMFSAIREARSQAVPESRRARQAKITGALVGAGILFGLTAYLDSTLAHQVGGNLKVFGTVLKGIKNTTATLTGLGVVTTAAGMAYYIEAKLENAVLTIKQAFGNTVQSKVAAAIAASDIEAEIGNLNAKRNTGYNVSFAGACIACMGPVGAVVGVPAMIGGAAYGAVNHVAARRAEKASGAGAAESAQA